MQLKRKCQGSLRGNWLPGGSSYLLYFKSHPLLHFDGIWGNLFRLKSYIPSSTLAFVDHNKIMLIFLIVGFLFERNKHTAHPICVYFQLYICKEGETRHSAGIWIHCQGLKDEWGLVFNKNCYEQRKSLTYRHLSPQVLPLLPAFPHFYLHVWGSCQPCCVGGWRGEILAVSWHKAGLSLHLLDMTPWWVKDKLAWGPASQPLPAFSLGHISGVNGFQGQTWLSLLNILEATSVGRC